MWRLIGAALLSGGGLWMGLQAAGELAAREKALESWKDALTLLAGELTFRLPDLPCLLEELAARAPSPAGEDPDGGAFDPGGLGTRPPTGKCSGPVRLGGAEAGGGADLAGAGPGGPPAPGGAEREGTGLRRPGPFPGGLRSHFAAVRI